PHCENPAGGVRRIDQVSDRLAGTVQVRPRRPCPEFWKSVPRMVNSAGGSAPVPPSRTRRASSSFVDEQVSSQIRGGSESPRSAAARRTESASTRRGLCWLFTSPL